MVFYLYLNRYQILNTVKFRLLSGLSNSSKTYKFVVGSLQLVPAYRRQKWQYKPLQIRYEVVSVVALPFGNQRFDFATAFMCFMDIPETEKVLAEAYRVLKPGGFLQFSISHPCYTTPHRKNLRDANGTAYAVEVGGYFTDTDGFIDEWIFTAAPPELLKGLSVFRIPHFNRTVSQWVNTITATGFVIEQMAEPTPSAALIKQMPKRQVAGVVAYFLQFRCRKPA